MIYFITTRISAVGETGKNADSLAAMALAPPSRVRHILCTGMVGIFPVPALRGETSGQGAQVNAGALAGYSAVQNQRKCCRLHPTCEGVLGTACTRGRVAIAESQVVSESQVPNVNLQFYS